MSNMVIFVQDSRQVNNAMFFLGTVPTCVALSVGSVISVLWLTMRL